jgi:hypothetical protein
MFHLIFRHRPVVLLETGREIMGPIVLRNEKKIGDRSRGESGQERALARIADGSRWKPNEEIGIMR